MADITLTGTLQGVGNKGPIGPVALALMLTGQRTYIESEFRVDPADALRSIALPTEGSAQRLFLICADGDFDFTINGAGPTYGFRAGEIVNGLPTGVFILPGTPLVNSFEVSGVGAVAVNGYWLRVVES